MPLLYRSENQRPRVPYMFSGTTAMVLPGQKSKFSPSMVYLGGYFPTCSHSIQIWMYRFASGP